MLFIMVEYIHSINRRVLTKIIEEKKRERYEIVTEMLGCIELNDTGIHEYGCYMLAIESDKIQLVTPNKIYIKPLCLH